MLRRKSKRELDRPPCSPDFAIAQDDGQLIVTVNERRFIVKGSCPLCRIDRMLDRIRRVLMNPRSRLTAAAIRSTLAAGERLIELRTGILEELTHGE